MNTITSFVKRHPLITLLVLACGLGWLPWLGRMPVILGPSVSIAAIIVVAMTRGKTGLTALLRQLARWRVGWQWYAVALGIPVAVTLVSVSLNVLLGAPAPSAAQLAGWPRVFVFFPVIFLLFGPAEELGWRGYVLPHLQARYSALVATLILTPIALVWHLPLFLVDTGIPWSDIPFMFFLYIVFTWIYNSTKGSVLLVMLLHAMQNAFSGEFFSTMFSGADAEQLGWLRAALYGVVALIVIVRTGPARLSSRPDLHAAAVGEPVLAV